MRIDLDSDTLGKDAAAGFAALLHGRDIELVIASAQDMREVGNALRQLADVADAFAGFEAEAPAISEEWEL